MSENIITKKEVSKKEGDNNADKSSFSNLCETLNNKQKFIYAGLFIILIIILYIIFKPSKKQDKKSKPSKKDSKNKNNEDNDSDEDSDNDGSEGYKPDRVRSDPFDEYDLETEIKNLLKKQEKYLEKINSHY